jgi:hypothetical protein
MHPQYASDKIHVDWERFEQYRDGREQPPMNIIEREMEDIININHKLFNKWIEL